MKRALFILIFCIPLLYQAQEKKKKNPRISLRGNIGIPRIIGSKMFRTAFNGIVETGVSTNIILTDNFFIGAGYQYTNFQVNKKEWSASVINATGGTVTSVFYKTTLEVNSGYIKLGYDYFFSDIGFVSYALNMGYSSGAYGRVIANADPANQPWPGARFSAPYIQPELAFNFLAEKKISFSFMLSYTTLLYRFDARAPQFNHVGPIKEAKNRANMNWINIGIGFNIFLGK
jgi:hypothetical protein